MKPLPIAIAAILVAASAYAYIRLRGSQAVAKTEYTVAFAKKSSVKKTVSANGILQPWTTVDIKSKAGGRIDLLAVDVGSRVRKGQIVAKIDPTDSLLTYRQAKANTESALAKEKQTGKTYQLTVAQAEIAVQQAAANLASANASFQQAASRLQTAQTESVAQPFVTAAAIDQAKAALDNATEARTKLTVTQSQDRASVLAAFNQAAANNKNLQTNLARQQSLLEKGYVSQSSVDALVADAAVAEATLASAKLKLDSLASQQASERDASDASVRQAEAAYRAAKANSYLVQSKKNSLAESKEAVAQARAAIKASQAQLAAAIQDRANGAIRQLDITSATAAKESASASLQNAKSTLDQTTVTAPVEGIVLQKYVEQGTIITSGLSLNSSGTSIVQLGDVSRMYVDVAVDETDIASIRLGEPVDLTFDAFPNRTFSGKVTKINPLGVVVSNVTTIHVRVEVDNTAKGFGELKPQMNATCEFIEATANDVIAIPNEAVQTDGNGSYIEVLAQAKASPKESGKPKTMRGKPTEAVLTDITVERRDVLIGLVGNETTEIKSGLQVGEQFVVSKETPKVEEKATTGAAAFGGGGGSPGMGGRR